MSFVDCVEDAVRGGVLTREAAEELYRRAEDYGADFRLDLQHSAESAERLGIEEAVRNARRQTRLARYQTARQAIRNTENVRAARSHPRGTAVGIASILGRDVRGETGALNVDYLQKTITGQAHAMMADAIAGMRTTFAGLKQDKELVRNVMRELHGQASGDTRAAQFAPQAREVAEFLRQRFNRAGGAIPFREDWGWSHWWDPGLVNQVDMRTWVDTVKPALNRNAMTNQHGAPLADGELELMLQDVYEAIRTDGVSRLTPGTRGGTKLANRRQEHRVLVFSDADAWLRVNDQFGNPDLFQTMMRHIDSMAHDIALLEILGPNPNAGYRYLADVALKDGAAPKSMAYNEGLFRTVNGATERASSLVGLADFSDAVRSWLVAAKLGSATLSAISDVGFVKATASLNGLSFTRTMGRMLEQLNPANEADRIMATRMGLTAMQWANSMTTAQRYSNVVGRGVSGKAAEVTLRASGLTAWTDAWKRAFGMEFYGNLGEAASRAFGELDDQLRLALERYDITPDMWDEIRATELLEHGGARFVSVENILARTDIPIGRREELSNKLAQMVLTETNFAVPEPDARARAITSGALFGSGARGTPSGELGRFTFQFKGFPVSALLFHVFRARNLKDGSMNPLAYTAMVGIGTTLLGGLAIQLKEISRGKNPRPMDDPAFWPAAFVQGGGLGIYGDFLFTDVNRFGGGLTSTFAGPFVPLINDTAKLTIGQLWDVAKGKDTNFAAEAIDYARRYTPGGSLWYSRLLFEREALDQLQLMADDEAFQTFRRRMRKRERDYNQTYWWRMGETAPREAPQLDEVIGQ